MFSGEKFCRCSRNSDKGLGYEFACNFSDGRKTTGLSNVFGSIDGKVNYGTALECLQQLRKKREEELSVLKAELSNGHVPSLSYSNPSAVVISKASSIS